MKKVNCIRLLLALSLGLTLLPSLGEQARAAEDMAAAHTKDNGCPYYIMVNRTMNTVTVYTLDEEGCYTVPVKAMVCSVGRKGHNTPLGTFSITGTKKQWCAMLDGTYGQYSSQFSGYYLFHSVCYSKADPGTLLAEEYNMLGQRASLGCVRLQVADAKWIYDNCDAGTKVTVYDGEDPGPLGKPAPLVEHISQEEDNGWEPSDPRTENPWRNLLVRSLTLDAAHITLEAGMRQRLWPAVEPEGARYPQTTVTWTVDDPDVASVDGGGRVTGLREGTATVTAACGDCRAKCTVTVTGQLLHFTDVEPGAWYYSDVRYAYEKGIFSGSGKKTYTPEGSMTGITMAQALYNLAGRPETETGSDHWSSSALDWAAKLGIIDGVEDFNKPLTRRELVVMLYQFQGGAADQREDAPADPAQRAVSWAVGKGLIQGAGEEDLDLDCPVTRAQAAAILRRYHEM